MKGKTKNLIRIAIVILTLMTAMFCIGINFKRLDDKVYAVTYAGNGGDYSQRDENNIILSVEKVGVISTGENYINDTVFKSALTSNATEIKQMPTKDGKYYYQNIVNGSYDKYVVSNGSFVMLNNTTYYQDGTTYYRNVSMSAQQKEKNVNMAEAIMITFGTYYMDEDDNLNIADSSTGSELVYANISATRNGQDISSEFPIRNFGNGNLFKDIAYIIPQKSGYDGYYTIDVNYFYNGVEYNQNFSFYLIFASSYNDSVTYNSNTYRIDPTIECAGGSMTSVGGTYHYLLGNTSDNYPVLTYDYTKYSMNYTYTANGRVTTYRYYISTSTNLGGTTATLYCDITQSGQTTTKNLGVLSHYNNSNTARNLISIVLTEMGSYTFNFEYIYAGYNYQNAPSMNLSVASKSIEIHGFELKYSKANYQEAQMRYLLISKGQGDKVDIVIPNGYEYGSTPNESSLGIAYALVEDSSKVGTILTSTENLTNDKNTIDANVNNIIKSEVQDLDLTTSLTSKNIYDISKALNTDDYAKTNQGSLWLSTNDAFIPTSIPTSTAGTGELGSFYFFSQSAIKFGSSDVNIANGVLTLSDEAKKTITYSTYTNQTSFNRTGYYLVFIKVDINGTLNSNGISDYYQVFAFRFISETAQVNLQLKNGNILGDNGFTRDDVTISWAKEGVFERTITACYYSVKNQFYSANQLLNTTSYSLTSGQTLGEELSEGEGASYLIEIISEGEGRSYHLFTIDRQAISGVNMYEVEMNTSLSSSIITYGFASSNGRYNTIDSSITDSLATLFWNNKSSGAKITATYTLTPFIVDTSIQPGVVRTTASEAWFSTNYKLGKTVGPFQYNKASALGAEVSYSSILQRAGIYIFTLTDEAGNSCKYMFVYDNSENYFMIQSAESVNPEMMTRQSVIFSDSVTLTIGTHKVISLFDSESMSNVDRELSTLLNLASSNSDLSSFSSIGYYIGTNNNVNAIKDLFTNISNTTYLRVKNESLSVYGDNGIVSQINNISINNRSVTIVSNENTASTLQSIYVLGANQRDRDARDSSSFMTIEINTDNSRGMAYYSNDKFSLSDIDDESDNVTRLYYSGTGLPSDGMIGTRATSDNYLAFTWYIGNGDYEVESVYYDFYELDMSGNEYSDNLYYYVLSSQNTYLYRNGEVENGAVKNDDGTRVFALLNVVSNKTREGLYVITRTYTSNESLSYYFIVDRNGIINSDLVSNPINGSEISIGLKENETTFNNFSGINMTQQSFIDNANNGQQVFYYNYLTTDKMPAVLNIPVGKYFLDGNGSNYDAGLLTFTLYFVDRQNQVDGRAHIIFEIDDMDCFDTENYIYENGVPTYYKVDITKYLGDSDSALLTKLVRTDNDGSWLCLPGDYVVVIKDKVESSTTNNSKTFGFSIEPTLPNVDIYAVNDREDNINQATQTMPSGSNMLTTSTNYVKIELPKYDKNSTSAGIDIDYIVITRSINGRTATYYINYPYTTGNININDDVANSMYVKNTIENGEIVSRTLYLDHSSFASTDSIEYTIYIRYDLGSQSDNDAYINAYYSYNGSDSNQHYSYYENTYKVIVDRVPPSANIENLQASDNFIGYFNEENDSESLFENAILEEASGTYYVNRYSAYYNQGKQASDLYAFRVYANTEFDTTDVAYVYYSDPYKNLSDITMNLPYYTGYKIHTTSSADSTYGAILGNSYYGSYVVIIEADSAGNMTQYIIHYFENENSSDTQLVMNLPVTQLASNGEINTNSKLTIDTSSTNVMTFTIFSILSLGENIFTTNNNRDMFYRFELENINSGEIKSITTNATTSFTNEGLGAEFVNLINSNQGNYILTIYTRTNTYMAYLNYYVYDEIVNLNIEELFEVNENGNYIVTFAGANVVVNNIVYYASTIEIIKNGETSITYVCDPSNNYSYYINGNEDITYTSIVLDQNSTYKIIMTDAFGREYTRNISTSGKDFYSISFDGDSERNYYTETYGSGVAYYTYNITTITYDTALYTASLNLNINNTPIAVGENNQVIFNNQIMATFDRNSGVIIIYPYWGEDFGGAIIQANVTIQAKDDSETVNYVVFTDTVSEAVTIRDINSNSQTIIPKVNVDYSTTDITNSFVGSMTLVIRPIERSYFEYNYILHRTLDSGVSDDIELDNSTRITLSESGTYRLELQIFTADGYYLGNKVYTFAIHIVSGQLYYVEGIAGANSSFTFKELIDPNNNTNITIENIASALSISADELSVYLNYSHNLYISNDNLLVSASSDQGASMVWHEYNFNNGYIFTIYRVYTSTYSQFLATLKTPNDEDFGYTLISDLGLTKYTIDSETNQYVPNELTLNNTGDNIFYGEINSEFVLSFKQLIAQSSDNIITRKNSLLLEIWHNDIYVDTIELTSVGDIMTYTIKGNGYYKFRFLDLAGNTHLFTSTNVVKDGIEIATLREIILTMNSEQIVDYSYFNGDIVISAYNSIVYNGTLSITSCTINGNNYTPTRAQNTFTFTGFGTFRVSFEAKYNDSEGEHTLYKSVVFTIINPNEARTSIDLTNLSNYEITKVTNSAGKDITSAFKSIVNKANGMTLTYDKIINNKDLFAVTSGKQTFNITYVVSDGIYPDREVTFAVTLNNEQPYIECSLSAGDTTKDGFSINYNAGIIYSQVGDSYLYINNELIAVINSESSNQINTRTFTFDNNGAGDYYIQLISSSGNVISSFKVTIEEPLNTWAIIIIVVVSVIVIAVVTIFIVLRHKMRIR